MLYLAADHAGFELKNKIKKHLEESGIEVVDVGPFVFDPTDDYPDYVIPAMNRLRDDNAGGAILICRNGVGVSMLANKFDGVRAALSWSAAHAASSRTDDNTNVLTLPADYITEDVAKDVVGAWLSTDFSNEERHKRRLQKGTSLPRVGPAGGSSL
ncbi:MAG: hypothetical protein UX79_C0024G0002 [candidate division WWE3 bacterium GW2011_GWB1_47_11]|uniref:Ribose-5-phosphate isomerase n=1 Tax=candidate division WWE3 bacterium GW2011_GWB1_47_11 TaxID=1619117 RepID=A0A0G1TSA2_UNCKA|nr:MAG: hypothetical protein UX79_C0024G0002 [candidate division WWE3 bacterium GW2011_GWB1_47_11]